MSEIALEHNRHVKWKESELAEHDKTRGTRQVIDQPDTPYIYHDSDAEEIVKEASKSGPQAIDMGYLRQRLGVAETLRQAEEEQDMDELRAEADGPAPTLFEIQRRAFMSEQAKNLLSILGGDMIFSDEEDEDIEHKHTAEAVNHRKKREKERKTSVTKKHEKREKKEKKHKKTSRGDLLGEEHRHGPSHRR